PVPFLCKPIDNHLSPSQSVTAAPQNRRLFVENGDISRRSNDVEGLEPLL
ncbi:10459_t:CDS:1, partial [Acaulospora colombiana]